MEYETLEAAWDASDLPKYFTRMDELGKIGYKFDKSGDMCFYESEALNEWLGDDRTIMDVTFAECEAALTRIKDRAQELFNAASGK